MLRGLSFILRLVKSPEPRIFFVSASMTQVVVQTSRDLVCGADPFCIIPLRNPKETNVHF
jgi:hypothetical protein